VEKHHQHWKFGYASGESDRNFDFAFPSLGGGPTDRQDQLEPSDQRANSANLRSSAEPRIYVCRGRSDTTFAGGRL